MTVRVRAVNFSAAHTFGKAPASSVELVAGLGVAGDVHAGKTVQHRSRVAADPTRPNLRQVHLIHEELFTLLGARGFTVAPGHLGENITTTGGFISCRCRPGRGSTSALRWC